MVLPVPMARDAVAMRWQSAAGYRFRMPGGYFLGPGPDGQAHVSGGAWSATGALLIRVDKSGQPAVATANRRRQAALDLKTWGAERVVLGPGPSEAALEETVNGLLGAQPQSVDGVKVWTVAVLPAEQPPSSPVIMEESGVRQVAPSTK
jgi:dolichyl-phosphate beta-glucosyltransferase